MRFSIQIAIPVLFLSANPVAAEPSAKTPSTQALPISFDAVIEKIEQTEKSGAWKEPDWDKSFFVQYVNRAVNQTRVQTKKDSLHVPTSVSELSVIEPNKLLQGGTRLRRALIVTKNQDFLDISDSIVLSTGVVRAVSIENSIVISKGAIQTSHCNGSLLFAGHYIEIAHDQGELFNKLDEDDDAKITGRSFLMSGSSIDIASAAGTVCYAPRFIKIAHARKVVILNSPNVKISFDRGGERIDVKGVGLIPKRREFQFPKELSSIQIVNESKRPLFITSHSGKEHIMRPGYRFPDELVKEFPMTKNWKVSSIHDKYLLFENDKGDFAGCGFWFFC